MRSGAPPKEPRPLFVASRQAVNFTEAVSETVFDFFALMQGIEHSQLCKRLHTHIYTYIYNIYILYMPM